MLIIVFVLLKVGLSDYINSTSFSAVFFIQPSDTGSSFNLQLQLFYSSSNTKAKISQIWVTISLIPYSPLSGVLGVYTDSQGLATFSSVYSMYKGTFNLVAIANNYSPYASNTFTISTGRDPFYYMYFYPTQNFFSYLFNIDYKVRVFDSDWSITQLPCTINWYDNQGYYWFSDVCVGTCINDRLRFYYHYGTMISYRISAYCNKLSYTYYMNITPMMLKLEESLLVNYI